MKNYLMTVITVSLCVGVYNVISPGFKGIEKYSKMIGMLVVLCVIISPIKSIMNTFDDEWLENVKDGLANNDYNGSGEYDEIFRNYLTTYSIDELKNEIGDLLLEKFEIPGDECEITVTTENKNDNLAVGKVQILLSGKSIFKNPYSIEEYFANLLNCDCQVLIK